MITYDTLLAYLREEAAKGRVFEAAYPRYVWSCKCPIASMAIERLGTQPNDPKNGDMGTTFNGRELRIHKAGARSTSHILDATLCEFSRRIDEAAIVRKQSSVSISAAVALQILEAVV